MSKTEKEILAVEKFQEYLRIKTVHPDPDYGTAVKFLDQYGAELGLDTQHVVVGEEQLVIVVMTWPGKDSSLPSIVLNSHTDVVPVFEEHWKHDPWAAFKDEKRNIYGRGSQDMKCVGIQYLEAIRRLKLEKNECFQRTIHLTFLPDEEIGGFKGMKLFLENPTFKALNVGFVLDEGLAHPENKYSVFYGERSPWWVRVKCEGNPGHGSRFIQNTAAEKLQKVMAHFLQYRKEEEARMKDTCLLLGDVTTLNLTMLKGGILPNVVPAELFATFDIRIPPNVDMDEMEGKIRKWCKESGEDVTYEFLQKNTVQKVTNVSKEDPWWNAFSSAIEKRGTEIVKEIFPAATDSRYLREAGFPAIGFSPMRNTPILLHDHNEYLNEDIFLEGIDVYCDIVPALANMIKSF